MPAENQPTQTGQQRKYRWPWLVLAAILLGLITAVLMMSREVERMRRIRDANLPPPSHQSTNR